MKITSRLSSLRKQQRKTDKGATLTKGGGELLPEKLTEENMINTFSSSEDVITHNYMLGKSDEPVLVIYCQGLADSKELSQFILPDIEAVIDDSNNDYQFYQQLQKRLPIRALGSEEGMEELVYNVFSGELVLYFKNSKRVFFLTITEEPNRTPEESNTEISIRGPKDGFTEDLSTNVALVRKRLRTNSMYNETFIVGKRSKTKVSLLYLEDVVDPTLIEEARKRINDIDIDVLDSSSILEELLADSPYSIFPLCEFAGRPDYVVNCLTRGKFAILISGVPNGIIAPATFTMLLKTPEDLHTPYYFVTMEVMLRFLGLLLAIFLPSLWVAIMTFHLEQVPFQFLTTVALSRHGIPFPTSLETIMMLIFLELFREAVVRLAKPVGQTVAVVGGLIIGDAAIQGGLASATLLVVIALSIVGTFTLVNQSLNGTVTILRLYSFFLAAFLGIFGFIISLFSILWYLSTLTSFNVPYLSTGGTTNFKDFLSTFGRLPWSMMKKRPTNMNTKDQTRKGESS
ncbi:spore germination protein [Bacillus sp. FJAT-45350]|uniref:spore germination protein n=1 Tax=Bacillus sp. FJAT-45350 TaxID=2011014 RepID=UPI000BB7749F|nr:spore germination protein [Bacillus sp. FJAT-45350]